MIQKIFNPACFIFQAFCLRSGTAARRPYRFLQSDQGCYYHPAFYFYPKEMPCEHYLYFF